VKLTKPYVKLTKPEKFVKIGQKVEKMAICEGVYTDGRTARKNERVLKTWQKEKLTVTC
jgi:hypothetical protein